MMGNRFSSAKHSIAECDRCGFRFKLKILKRLIIKTKQIDMLVCPQCWDPDHPQLQLGMYPVDDPQGVRDPRPDRSYYTSGPLPDGTLGEGSRVIQWGWNPVGLGHIPIGLLTPNKLWTTTYVGRVTIQTDQEVPAPYLVERASAADSFSAVLTPAPPPLPVFFDPQTSHPSLAFSNDNLTVATTLSYNPSGGYGVIATEPQSSGKHYVEFTVNAYNTAGVLVPPSTVIVNLFAFGFATGPNYIGIPTAIAVGANANSWGVNNTAYTGNIAPVQNVPAFSPWALWHSYPATGATNLSVSELPISGTVVGMAVDFDAGKIWFSVDGLWIDRGTGAGDPVTGINPAFTFTPNTSLYPAATLNYDTTITGNFGAAQFTYLMPSGYLSWGNNVPPQPAPQPPVEVVVNINTSNSVNVVVIDAVALIAGVDTFTPATYTFVRYGTNTAPLVLLGSSKVYFEVELIGTAGIHVGVTGLFGSGSFVALLCATAATTGSTGIYLYSSASSPVQLSPNPLQVGQTVAVAIDTVSNKVWLAVDNAWVQSGNPSAGVNPTFVSSPTTPYYPDVRMICTEEHIDSPLTQSKFKTSALKYAPPAGFVALQTALNT